MSLYNGPPRGGSRGGQDQFNWSNVKADKDREYYLGHSEKALTGRWQKGKDVYWYTREKKGDGVADAELQRVKEREQQLMDEALGLKPKASVVHKRQLEDHELQQLLQRTGHAPHAADGLEEEADPDARIKGLGYAPRAMGGVAAMTTLDGYDDLSQREPRPSGGAAAAGEDPQRGHEEGHQPTEERERKRSKHSSRDKDKISKHSSSHKSKKSKKEKKEKRSKKDR